MRSIGLFHPKSFSGMSLEERLKVAGLFFLLLYVLAGVIYCATIAPGVRFTDERVYLKLSYNLLHGPGYSTDGGNLTASRPPGYAFFLAAIRALGGDLFSFRVAQFLLTGATILLVCSLCFETKMLGGILIVTGLVACYPVLFYIATTLYPQTLAGFLFVLALVLLLKSPRGLGVNLGTGCSFGALLLEVPTFLATMAVVLVAARFLKIIRGRDVLLITLAAAILVGGWTLRNALCFHRFVPFATNSGMNFLEGNNEHANAYEAASNGEITPYFEQTERLRLDEFQSDAFYRHAALAWIKEHPGDALILYLQKVLNFFNFVNVYSSENYAEVSSSMQVLLAASYLFLLLLLGWRLLESKSFPLTPREKLFLAVYILSAFTSAVFFTRIRLRLPYDYLIIAVIATNLSRHLELWLKQKNPASMPSGPSDNPVPGKDKKVIGVTE